MGKCYLLIAVVCVLYIVDVLLQAGSWSYFLI